MEILALTSSYPRFEGDSTAPFVESITRKLGERGYTTHLVLPEHAKWRHPEVDGAIHFHPSRYSPRPSWTPWGYSEALEGGVKIKRPLYALAPIVSISMLRTCNRLAKTRPFDLVHGHWVIPNGPIAALTARRQRLPLVISLHGSDISVAHRSRWLGKVARWSFERADAVTAPSEDLLERARALGARGHLELIPYGGDAEAFQVEPAAAARMRERLLLGESDVAVLGIGRFVHAKGFDDLIQAVARARSARPAIRLVFVGDGDLRDDLRAQVRAAGLEPYVSFVGMAAREEVPEFLAAADMVAVPSVHYAGYVDGLPNVVLEAMAASKPVIATRVGGLPQVVHDGENGLLVDERDPAALAGAIEMLAADGELRRRMGESGRALARGPLSWDAAADRFAAVYERMAR